MNYNVIGTDGAVYGPVDLETLKKWVADNRVLPNTMLEEVGSSRRFEARTLPELFPSGTAAPSAVFHAAYDAPKAGTTGAGQAAATPGGVNAAAQRIAGPTGYSSISANAPINNNLLLAIFSMLCCCFPLGLIAVIFAAGVNSKQASGDRAGAYDSAEKAKILSNVAIGLGVAIGVLYAGFAGYTAYKISSGQLAPPPQPGTTINRTQ